MGLISSLNRSEETATPSCPLVLTTTVEPATATPLMPAIKVLVWIPAVPTRVVSDSPATPTVADVDIVIACSEIASSVNAQGDVRIAYCVVT